MVNRSSCASGNGYVPSYSIGFCVAITMNGRASSYETPSTVTCCSCMHSSSADCVLGEARLISSTRRRLAKTGPGLNWNSFERWLNMFTPVTSDGNRSGVNCMRENETSSDRASAFASIVFPTPGKSSRIRCPSLTRQRTQSRSVSSGACTTRPRLSIRLRIVSAGAEVSTRSLPGSVTQQLLRRIYDRSGDLVFGRLGNTPLAGSAEEDDLVLLRVKADVVARNVVVDDEVDPLQHQLLARTRETLFTSIGREADQHLTVLPPLGKRSQDVGGWLEGDLPVLAVLWTLPLEGFDGTVVGDCGGHQDEVGVRVRQRGLEHRNGGRRLHHLDATRPRNREVRGEQRDLGTALVSLLRERDAHATRRAVAEKPDRVERLACSPGTDEDAAARERIGLTQELAATAVNLLGLGHAAESPLALGRLAFVRSDDRSTARAHGLEVRLCCRMRPHARVHRGREQHRPSVREPRLGDQVVREPLGQLRQAVRSQRRDDEEVGARQMEVEILSGGAACQAEEGLCAHETLGRGRNEGDDLVPGPDEEPDELASLVGGNAARDADENAGHAGILPIRSRLVPPAPQRPEASASEAALAAGRTDVGGDASAPPPARQRTFANQAPMRVRGLRPRTFPAKRRAQLQVKARAFTWGTCT